MHKPIGTAGSMPGTTGFTMACFEAGKVKLGECLYSETQYLELLSVTSLLLGVLKEIVDDGILSNEKYLLKTANDAIAKTTGEQE